MYFKYRRAFDWSKTFERSNLMRNCALNACGTLLLSLSLLSLVVPAMRAQGDASANYKAKCVACHAPDGSGSGPAGKAMGAHDFRSPDVQKMSDADLAGIIANGKAKMPKFSDKLKDTEIKDLVSYIRGLSKKT
jgi:mono/diheme cytochrome c family protein